MRPLWLILCWLLTGALSLPADAQQAIFSAERLRTAATAYLQQQFSFPIVAEPTHPISDVELQATNVHAELQYLPRSTTTPFHTVRITFFCNGDPCRELLIPFKVQKKIAIPKAKRTLQKGTILKAGDIQWDTILVSLEKEGITAEQLLGFQLTRTLKAGTPITPKVLRHPESLSAGTEVQLIVRTAHILIRTKGRLLETAIPGKTVRVRPLQSRAAVQGIYKGNGIVQIQ